MIWRQPCGKSDCGTAQNLREMIQNFWAAKKTPVIVAGPADQSGFQDPSGRQTAWLKFGPILKWVGFTLATQLWTSGVQSQLELSRSSTGKLWLWTRHRRGSKTPFSSRSAERAAPELSSPNGGRCVTMSASCNATDWGGSRLSMDAEIMWSYSRIKTAKYSAYSVGYLWLCVKLSRTFHRIESFTFSPFHFCPKIFLEFLDATFSEGLASFPFPLLGFFVSPPALADVTQSTKSGANSSSFCSQRLI